MRHTAILRRAIESSTEPAHVLAARHGISVWTIWSWRRLAPVHPTPAVLHNAAPPPSVPYGGDTGQLNATSGDVSPSQVCPPSTASRPTGIVR